MYASRELAIFPVQWRYGILGTPADVNVSVPGTVCRANEEQRSANRGFQLLLVTSFVAQANDHAPLPTAGTGR